MATTRRECLRTFAGLGLYGSLGGLPRATALEPAAVDVFVALEPDLEPLVRRIEETPRDKCFDMITAELRDGLPYRRFLAAMFLAGVRNVNPQPPGFDLHCVFAVQAAHQMALDAVPGDRLLPLYWALDEFKKSQENDAKKKIDYRMTPLSGKLPSAGQAWKEFRAAMEAWDIPRAERAAAVLYRTSSAGEIIETLWRYGARDFRNIGHKAIYVANAWRTLETIGWRHAEPVLRSLTIGLLDFGADQRVNEYAYADQAYAGNVRRVEASFAKLPPAWSTGEADEGATRAALALLREGDVEAACDEAVAALAKGRANDGALWDAVHLAAGEQMMRQPGIVGLHAVTSVSALHTASQLTTLPETRLLMLLQGLGWICQFHKAQLARNEKRFDVDITALEPVELPKDTDAALAQVFATREKDKAAKSALAYGRRNLDVDAFTAAARSLVFAKVVDPHGYKYPASVFEDYYRVSPQWRPHLLAASMYYLPNSTLADAPLMQQAREAVAGLL